MSTRLRVTLISVVAVVTIVLSVVFATRFGTDPRLSPSPLIGHPAPVETYPPVSPEAKASRQAVRAPIQESTVTASEP